MTAGDLFEDTLRGFLEEPAHAFSLGVQGALAEFLRTTDEPCDYRCLGRRHSVVTQRGAMSIDFALPLRPYAHEYFSTAPGGWRQSLGLCLDARRGKRHGRKVITELGPDEEALNRKYAAQKLFDLGLAIPHVDVCISTSEPALIKALRAQRGESLFKPGSSLVDDVVHAGPRRVFMTAACRIEVSSPIPFVRAPNGPHTHLLPHRLGLAETAPYCKLDDQLCQLIVYPAHPCRNQQGEPRCFDPQRHAEFQSLLYRYGPAQYVEFKQQILSVLQKDGDLAQLPPYDQQFQRTAIRLSLRQLFTAGQLSSAQLERWQAVVGK